MQRSWPLVRTSPLASSSRNFAGRMIRPFSSRRGECVPRNTGPPPVRCQELHIPCVATTLLCPPHYSTFPHSQRELRLRRSNLWDWRPEIGRNSAGGGKWRTFPEPSLNFTHSQAAIQAAFAVRPKWHSKDLP